MNDVFTVRPYAGEADLLELAPLIEAAWRPDRQPAANIHTGDLFWRLREPEYEARLFLWEYAGKIAGFAEWNREDGTLYTQVHPRFTGGALEVAMLHWAQERATCPVTTSAADDDLSFRKLLASENYVHQAGGTNYHCRILNGSPVETPVLPEGYVIRSLRGVEEISARVQGHRDGWQSTKLTETIYRRLMETPGYRTDFDLAVVTPDGRFVATANIWLDASGAGLFEPVSTAPAYRRKGLGRALILYGLDRLARAGARVAWVGSVFSNPAATALYESAGMSVVRRDSDYTRNM